MSPSLIWPWRTKVGSVEGNIGNTTTQWRRIDQGQDLQGVTDAQEECLALADGVVRYAHDPGTNGAHFGDPYPVLLLEVAVDGIGAIYYGHTHPVVPEGTRVHQGSVIARTSSPGGGGAPDRWLEIGPWRNGPTGNGQWMHDHLMAAPTFGGDFLMALTDAEQRELLGYMRDVHAEVFNDDGAVRDIQSRIGNDVEPTLKALRADFDAYVKAHP